MLQNFLVHDMKNFFFFDKSDRDMKNFKMEQTRGERKVRYNGA